MGRQKKQREASEKSDFDEINKARIKIGMKPLEIEKRECLKCDAVFTATKRANNYLCDACRPKSTVGDNWEF